MYVRVYPTYHQIILECIEVRTAVPIDPDVAKVLRTASAYFRVAATNSPPPCVERFNYLVSHPIYSKDLCMRQIQSF